MDLLAIGVADLVYNINADAVRTVFLNCAQQDTVLFIGNSPIENILRSEYEKPVFLNRRFQQSINRIFFPSIVDSPIDIPDVSVPFVCDLRSCIEI